MHTRVVLSSRNNPLVHENMSQLPLFADYHDGSSPYYLGWFDFDSLEYRGNGNEVLAMISKRLDG